MSEQTACDSLSRPDGLSPGARCKRELGHDKHHESDGYLWVDIDDADLSAMLPEPLSPSPEPKQDVFCTGCGDLIVNRDGIWVHIHNQRRICGDSTAAHPYYAEPRAAAVVPQSPEIRYQLRNWHHVTCAGFGGQACTCLAQREALIAELANREREQ